MWIAWSPLLGRLLAGVHREPRLPAVFVVLPNYPSIYSPSTLYSSIEDVERNGIRWPRSASAVSPRSLPNSKLRCAPCYLEQSLEDGDLGIGVERDGRYIRKADDGDGDDGKKDAVR